MSSFSFVSNLPESDEALGERFLPADAIALDPDGIRWAAAQSQSTDSDINLWLPDPWSRYIHLLARLGLRKWLRFRIPHLSEQVDVAVLSMQPLPIGAVTVAIAATDCLEDGIVDVPQSVLTREFPPQLHLLIEVLEEIDQVQMRGFLPHDALVQAIQSAALQPTTEATYPVPVTWFDLNPDRFLVMVECSNQLPGRSLLFSVDLDFNPQQIAEAIARPALNAATWLGNQLDQVAQEAAWTLLPAFSYSPALRSLRSPVAQLDGIVSDLTRYQSVTIPAAARSVAFDFQVDGADLCLYLTTWELPTAGDRSDWMLLAILSPQANTLLPLGLTLQLRDAQELLSETTLHDSSNTFLYAQVAGAQDERFVISVRSPNGVCVAVPPITFTSL
ncbi:MAG: DUF1822 family protein [Leptolyngbyaceae cyanobacterium]